MKLHKFLQLIILETERFIVRETNATNFELEVYHIDNVKLL